ncbi:MAG: hypothetical protein QXU45_02480 [Candidatus Bathyarchaeia archaeon]
MSEKLAEKLKLPKTIFDNPSGISVEIRGRYYDPTLVLGEACPGNVTTRFNVQGDFEWVPIEVAIGDLIDCGRIYEFWKDDYETISVKELRSKERKIFFIWHDEEEIIPLKLKKVHSLTKFADSRKRTSNEWGYCNQCGLVVRKFNHKGHEFKYLRVDTESYPIIIKHIKPSTHEEGKRLFPIWLKDLSPEITFFDRYAQHLSIYEGAIGVTAVFKLHNGPSNIHGLYGFQYRGKPAAVGYKYYTEGFKVSLDLNKLRDLITEFIRVSKNDSVCRDLYIKFLIYKLVYDMLKEKMSVFDAELISKFLITKFTFNLTGNIDETIRDIYLSKVHPIARQKIERFMDTDKFRNLEKFVKASMEGYCFEVDEFVDHLVYTFVHSLSHVFIAAFCSCSGANENEVGEYIKINGDYVDFFIYERPLNGATRIIDRNFMHKAGEGRSIDFLHYVENILLSCPVAMSEDFIYNVIFGTSKEDQIAIGKQLEKLCKHEISLNEFILRLSDITQCCIPSKTTLLEKIRRIFRRSQIRGKDVDEFDLHFEIYLLYSYLRGKLKREPFPEEFTWLIENINTINTKDILSVTNNKTLTGVELFNELTKLRSLLKDEKIFIEEVQKRFLRTCVDGCPSCIGGICGDEIWGLSKYTLSRRLLEKLTLNTIKNYTFTFPHVPVDRVLDQLTNNKFVFLLSSYQYEEEMSRFIDDLIVKKGGSLRDFQIVKADDNSYKYLALIVV